MKMNVLINTPKEMPDLDENMEVHGHSETLEQITTETQKNVFKIINADIKPGTFPGELPIVSLQGRRNYKALRNWMVKHMEAYPELQDGFIVQFIDDSWRKMYEVKVCGKRAKHDITINGINYKIIEKTVSTTKAIDIADDRKADVKYGFKFPTTDK